MFSLTASCIGLVAIAANRSIFIIFPLLLFTSLSFMRRSVMHDHTRHIHATVREKILQHCVVNAANAIFMLNLCLTVRCLSLS